MAGNKPPFLIVGRCSKPSLPCTTRSPPLPTHQPEVLGGQLGEPLVVLQGSNDGDQVPGSRNHKARALTTAKSHAISAPGSELAGGGREALTCVPGD